MEYSYAYVVILTAMQHTNFMHTKIIKSYAIKVMNVKLIEEILCRSLQLCSYVAIMLNICTVTEVLCKKQIAILKLDITMSIATT